MFTRHTWFAAVVGIGGLLSQAHAEVTEYTLDPSRTIVSFEMRGLGTLQRGEFSRTAGTVMLDSTQERGELDIVIDARSLTTSMAATAKIVRGPSMLNIDAHPEIAYRAEHIVFSHGKPSRIDGELTLLGITQAVPLQISHYDCAATNAEGERCAIIATANLKRSAFGMTHYMLFASDDVKLAIRAEVLGVQKEE